MANILHRVKRKILDVLLIISDPSNLVRILPFFAFAIPFLLLYSLAPLSFEATWKGRTYYLFFIWLILLETVLEWEKLQTVILNRRFSLRSVLFVIVLLLPTIYVLMANFWGLNSAIVTWSTQFMGAWWAGTMPLSVEYLAFGALSLVICLVGYGRKDLRYFAMPALLLLTIGTFYTIDNFFPNGALTVVQFPALPTTTLAARTLNLMGYQTSIMTSTTSTYPGVPYLFVQDSLNPQRVAGFYVGWPCAGVDSLLIYAITVVLFLRSIAAPIKYSVIYFIIGAAVTYFINILRIVTIFLLAVDYGERSVQVSQFHDYYGGLYSITWIIAYPLIIIATRVLWGRIRSYMMVQKSPAVEVS